MTESFGKQGEVSKEAPRTKESELTPEVSLAIQQEVLKAFKDIIANPSAYPGVESARSTQREGKNGEPEDVLSITFDSSAQNSDFATLTIRNSSRTESKGGKMKFIPTITMEFRRETDKVAVFAEDRYPSSSQERGTRIANIGFSTDVPQGFDKLRGVKKPTTVTSGGLTLRGSATIYADSDTPRYGGKSFASAEDLRTELAKLLETARAT